MILVELRSEKVKSSLFTLICSGVDLVAVVGVGINVSFWQEKRNIIDAAEAAKRIVFFMAFVF